jgi:hypothetical protein
MSVAAIPREIPMRTILLALGVMAALQAVDIRSSEARPWYPWCARFADRSGTTSCSFSSFAQCQATISGIGGGCLQNWNEPPPPPRYSKPRRSRD